MIMYFIPDWDDRVDPGFDFINEIYTPGRKPHFSDVYAHQIYEEPPYDGVLVSRAVIDKSPVKYEDILNSGSIKHHLRLSGKKFYPVLGDCGAFSYWKQENPPYKSEEMLDYYQMLGFDYGVSIDHLIFAELEKERERRWEVTLKNAEDFLRLHRSGKYTFTPIGVVQGWSPESYRRGARELIKIGYDYIAIGGLVRSTTKDIIDILKSVQEELRSDTRVHLFGVNRPKYIGLFMSLGVTSFDSASPLRRAWIDGEKNYFLGEDAYSAIRVPYSIYIARKFQYDEVKVQIYERDALRSLREYDKGLITIEQVFGFIMTYLELSGEISDRTKKEYWRTLEERPWKRCNCVICREIGIEVIIFRGNNRNRRRGFHNTWQLYQFIRKFRDGQYPFSSLEFDLV